MGMPKDKPRKLTDLVVEEVSLVTRPAIQRTFLEVKEEANMGDTNKEKEVWTRAYINSLPDEAFAYIAPGGKKDEEGKTVPRSLRYFPHHNEKVKDPDDNDTVDIPHLRNALARVPQSNLDDKAKQEALDHLRKHAEALLPTYQMSREVKGEMIQVLTEAIELLQGELVLVQMAKEVEEKDVGLPEDMTANVSHALQLLQGTMSKYLPEEKEQKDLSEEEKEQDKDEKPEDKEKAAPVHQAEADEKINAIKELSQQYVEALQAGDYDQANKLLDQMWEIQWDLRSVQVVVTALSKGLTKLTQEKKDSQEKLEKLEKTVGDLEKVREEVEKLEKALAEIKEKVELIESTPQPSKASKELGESTSRKSLFKGVI